MNLIEKYKTVFAQYGVITPLQKAHFMAQIEHESGLKPISENLNYSAKRLVDVFPKYFPNIKLAMPYDRKAEMIANKVYANRMGNRDIGSGDGYKYRGRGFIQLTGKDNYVALQKATGIDVVNNPDLLLEESNALIAALWFWKSRGLSELATKDDIVAITKKINGGTNGLEDRKAKLLKWKKLI